MGLPKRTLSHILEEKSIKFLQQNLPENWICKKDYPDYGLDFNVEIVQGNNVTGINFSGQLKSTKEKSTRNFISVSGIKKTTVNRWVNRLEPVMIVVYVDEEKEAYWKWFNQSEVNLLTKSKTITIRVPKSNLLSTTDWDEIFKHVETIFRQKNGLDGLPEFSKLESEDEKLAWKYFFEKDYEKAYLLFHKTIQKEGVKYGLLVGIAQCQYELFHYPEALTNINKALSIKRTGALLNIKASILAEYGIRVNEKAKLLEAEKIFKKLSANSGDYRLHYNYANTLQHLNKYDKAIEEYTLALKINKNYAEAWKNLGAVYNQLGKFDKEIKCYDKALKINPSLPQAHMSKGITLFKDLKKTKEGLKYMLQSLEFEPNLSISFPLGYFWIGAAYLDLEDYNNSIRWIEEGLENNPDHKGLLYLKSNYYYKLLNQSKRKRLEAIQFFRYFDKIYPNDPENINRLLEAEILNEKSLQEVVKLLKEKGILGNINIEDLETLNIEIRQEISFIRCLYNYTEYKLKFPNSRHGFHITDIGFQTSNRFYDILDFIFLITLNRMENDLKGITNETQINFESLSNSINDSFLKLLPKLIYYILDVNNRSNDASEIADQISKLSFAIVHIGISEATTLLTYFTTQLEINDQSIKYRLFEKNGLINRLSEKLFLEVVKELYIFFRLPLE